MIYAVDSYGNSLSGWPVLVNGTIGGSVVFSDLDNDEWQDIYVANGFLLNDVMTSNVFFHNQKVKKFLKKGK